MRPMEIVQHPTDGSSIIPVLVVPALEYAYQWMKCASDNDRNKILSAPTPGVAKRWAGKVQIRSDWDKVKLPTMEFLQALKYTDLQLRSWLIGTYPFHIMEGNDWGDTFWGVCRGRGENHMGRILMALRDQYRVENR